jgi:glycosyltransferase involved in cell wall biosynthesis
MEKKRKVMILSDYEGVYTGFGRWKLFLLKELYKMNRYEIVSVAMAMQDGHPEFGRFPWKIRGVLPANPQELGNLDTPEKQRAASYGDMTIEKLVQEEKPDVIIGAQDSWGILFLADKKFFSHIPTVVSVTFDSLPLLPDTIEKAPKIKHYWSWNGFARKEFHRLGHKHVETWYPGLDFTHFSPNFAAREKLKAKHNLPKDSFGILFMFRNQLRKLVNKLIEGYALFKQQNPEIKNTYLHLHTCVREQQGWRIPDLAKQYGVPLNEIYFTYICRESKEYFVLPFQGEELDNPKTGAKKSLVTVDINLGVSEEYLGEIFQMNDFYVHPATSGATEIPLVQAAACGLPIATCDYSYGEDAIEFNKGAFSIEYDYATEIQTLFLKSNPFAWSIAKILKKVYKLSTEERNRLGNLSREWAVTYYEGTKNSKKIADFIDALPQHNWDFDISFTPKNPNAVIPALDNNAAWILTLYKSILNMDMPPNDPGVLGWLHNLSKGQSRADIEAFFRKTAEEENNKNPKTVEFEDILDKTGRKRLLCVMKESIGDLLYATCIIGSLKESYPEHDIYFATDPQYFDIFDGNPNIHKMLPYNQALENEITMTGFGEFKGYFDIYVSPAIFTQRHLNYLTNSKLSLNLN